MKLAGLGENVFTGIEDTVRMEKVIAIGECGLDRRSPICMKTQEEILDVQVGLAEELRKPLIIHCVKAYSEIDCREETNRFFRILDYSRV